MEDGVVSPNDLLELAESAHLLGIHPSTLRRWADAGKITHEKTVNGRRRFRRQVLDQARSEMHQPAYANKSGPVDSSIETHTLAVARQRSGELLTRPGSWYDRFSEEQRLLFRYSGQRLLGLLVQFISRSNSGETFLEEGKKIARDYGRICHRAKLSVSQTAEAFLFFRRTILESIHSTAGLSGPNDQDGLRVLLRTTDFFDALLVATIESFAALEE
jgi:excisionase family DNA binding protein